MWKNSPATEREDLRHQLPLEHLHATNDITLQPTNHDTTQFLEEDFGFWSFLSCGDGFEISGSWKPKVAGVAFWQTRSNSMVFGPRIGSPSYLAA
jgi:hypothetical protein